MKNHKSTIMLAGGGSGGPVAPLLAVAAQIKKESPDIRMVFVGTKNGPEKEMVQGTGVEFVPMSAAKLRRYLSFRNVIDIFVFFLSFRQAYRIINKYQPDLIFSVGGFVAVPICWVGRSKRIKVIIHQQDVRIGLANKLIAPFATRITTAFEMSAKAFYSGSGMFKKSKVRPIDWIGNPVRPEFLEPKPRDPGFFSLHSEFPVLVITGGGTGALQINQVVGLALPELVKSHQVIHVTGRGKNIVGFKHENYHAYEFLVGYQMADALKMAHVVIARAGLSTLVELSTLGKIAIIVPMPGTHQEDNALILKVTASAVVLMKEEFTPDNLVRVVNSLKFNVKRQELLSQNIQQLFPKKATEKLAKIILQELNEK